MEDLVNNGVKEKTVQWLQDNLRVVLSIIIVLIIAGGIYSYSNRTTEKIPTDDIQQVAQNETESANSVATSDKIESTTTKEKSATVAATQETETAIIETAGKGDSKTVLARRALASYLEKNQDSTLTAEHKIYIEDYLRKKTSHQGGVRIGTSIEFSKNSIQEAIAKSKNLNEKQLTNLHKYAVRVSSLS